MSTIDPVPQLSEHVRKMLLQDRQDNVLLLKLLGHVLQVKKGVRTYTNLTKTIASLVSESEWRAMPPS